MTDLADSPQAVVAAIKAHHAELMDRVSGAVGDVVSAARGGDVHAAVERLAAVLAGDVVPHARAEEEALYVAAGGESRLLVAGMIDEHRRLLALVGEIGSAADDPVAAVGAARAFRELFSAHVHKENELLLPALAGDPAVDMPALHGRMEQAFGRLRAGGAS